MVNLLDLKRQAAQLGSETALKLKQVNDGTITVSQFKQYMTGPTGAIAKDAEITASIKAFEAAQSVAGHAGASGGVPQFSGLRSKMSDIAPLGFGEQQLKEMHQAVVSRQSYAIKRKDFSSVDSLLPPQLSSEVIGPQYEDRIADHLPAQATTAPSWEYIRHTSTTGAVAPVGEGEAKPELVFVTDKVVVPMIKLAAHAATSHESIEDWGNFATYVTGELRRQLLDAENDQLLNGDGTDGNATGFLATSGILVQALTDETPLDGIELAIAKLRTGAALATANLLILHPNTWSATRRSKDLQDRYLTTADPTTDVASSAWGVPVLTTTQIAAGAGLLLDTRKAAYVVVRESFSLKTGNSDDDFVRNLTRFIGEERLNLAVERPGGGVQDHRPSDQLGRPECG